MMSCQIPRSLVRAPQGAFSFNLHLLRLLKYDYTCITMYYTGGIYPWLYQLE